jgi:CHAD domain-containing protein
MPNPPFLSQFRRRLVQLRKNAAAPERLAREKGRLHAFRVALKHWRAYLRLLRDADPTFPYPEVYAPFKPLFAKAGTIRFWQLQEALLEKIPGDTEDFSRFYQKYIRRQRQKARKAFQKKLRKTDLPKWSDLQAELRLSVEKCSEETIRAYFFSLQNTMCGHLQKRHRTAPFELHELRKNFKEYGINRLVVEKYWHIEIGPPLDIATHQTELDDCFGQWHDLEAASAQLANDLKTDDWPADMIAGGKRLLDIWKKAEHRLLRQVTALLKPAHQRLE